MSFATSLRSFVQYLGRFLNLFFGDDSLHGTRIPSFARTAQRRHGGPSTGSDLYQVVPLFCPSPRSFLSRIMDIASKRLTRRFSKRYCEANENSLQTGFWETKGPRGCGYSGNALMQRNLRWFKRWILNAAS